MAGLFRRGGRDKEGGATERRVTFDKAPSKHLFSDLRRDDRKSVAELAVPSPAKAGEASQLDGDVGNEIKTLSLDPSPRDKGNGTYRSDPELAVPKIAPSVAYAVDLVKATLEMHLFGPFMGFLYELIETLNTATNTEVGAAVVSELQRALVSSVKDITSKRRVRNYASILEAHQKCLRALTVLEVTLRNCSEVFLSSVIDTDFQASLVEIMHFEGSTNRMRDIEHEQFMEAINELKEEQAALCIRILEWLEYNKSREGEKIRKWFGKYMDDEWQSAWSEERSRALSQMWSLAIGSKYQWMAEREDAAEVIQKRFRGYLVRKNWHELVEAKRKLVLTESDSVNRDIDQPYSRRLTYAYDMSDLPDDDAEVLSDSYNADCSDSDENSPPGAGEKGKGISLLQSVIQKGGLKGKQLAKRKKTLVPNVMKEATHEKAVETGKESINESSIFHEYLKEEVQEMMNPAEYEEARKLARKRILSAAASARNSYREERVKVTTNKAG